MKILVCNRRPQQCHYCENNRSLDLNVSKSGVQCGAVGRGGAGWGGMGQGVLGTDGNNPSSLPRPPALTSEPLAPDTINPHVRSGLLLLHGSGLGLPPLLAPPPSKWQRNVINRRREGRGMRRTSLQKRKSYHIIRRENDVSASYYFVSRGSLCCAATAVSFEWVETSGIWKGEGAALLGCAEKERARGGRGRGRAGRPSCVPKSWQFRGR